MRILAWLAFGVSALAAAPGSFEIAIVNGRVMDPASGLDGVRNVAIAGGRIVAITAKPVRARTIIDATGLVVAPGFIDLHQHSQTPEAYRAKVLDGVTSALEMESGVPDIDAFYAERDGKALINFGATVSHANLRTAIVTGGEAVEPKGEAATRRLTKTEIQDLRRRVEHGLERGAPGVGLLVSYTPGATPFEVLEMFRAAARFPGASVHVHVRDLKEPQHWLETDEVLADSLITGAPLQIVHVNSSYGEDAPELLEILERARARGLDVTAEAYPYIAAMNSIEGAEYDDWESWPDAKFQRYEWAATGERLTRDTFGRYRKRGGLLVIHGGTEEALLPTITSPLTMIASDGILEDGVGHPRAAGTFSRVLGRYVREQKALSLMEALRKMTIMPARRLEARVPEMRNRGRIGVGADADITVFDPSTVVDRATYRAPAKPPEGIRHVLVNGVIVVQGGKLRDGILPGRPIRGPIGRGSRDTSRESGLSSSGRP